VPAGASRTYTTEFTSPSNSTEYPYFVSNQSTGETVASDDFLVDVVEEEPEIPEQPDDQPETSPSPTPSPSPSPSPSPQPGDGDGGEQPDGQRPYDGPLTYLDPLGLFGTSKQLDLFGDN
jgi:hypothetical protein